MPIPEKDIFPLLELADILSDEMSTDARGPYLDRLLTGLWRGEFEGLGDDQHTPCREATLRVLRFCDAVPDFGFKTEGNIEDEYRRLEDVKYTDYNEVGQSILKIIEFPHCVVLGLLGTQDAQPSSPSRTNSSKPRGRRKGDGEIDDESFLLEMKQLVDDSLVTSPNAAAWKMVNRKPEDGPAPVGLSSKSTHKRLHRKYKKRWS